MGTVKVQEGSCSSVPKYPELICGGKAIDTNDKNQPTGDIPVYFGAGCFWHFQHEFIEAERQILKRNDESLTALAGYGGSKQAGYSDPVCYHNSRHFNEYSKLGYAEAVGLKIPAESFEAFAETYINLLDFPSGNRGDAGDRGAEYRSVVAFPGGMKSPYAKKLQALADAKMAKFVVFKEGAGSDPDTLNKRTVYVHDIDKFVFHRAELYHQFHDGFMPGRQYPNSYHDLRTLKQKLG